MLSDDEDDCLHTYAIEIDFGLIVFCMFHINVSLDVAVVVVVASVSGTEDPGSKGRVVVVVFVVAVETPSL